MENVVFLIFFATWITCKGIYDFYILRRLWAFRRIPYVLWQSQGDFCYLIPARDEAENLRHLLSVLPAEKTYVVDDHSTDDTAQVVREKKAHLISLPAGREGKKAALEYGMSHVGAQWVHFLDADVRPHKGVTGYLLAASKPSAQWVSGPIRIAGRGWATQFQAMESGALTILAAGSLALGKPTSANAANLLVRRQAYKQVGGMQKHLAIPTGDDDFLLHEFYRVLGAGALAFCKSFRAQVEVPPAASFSQWWQQRRRWTAKSRFYTLTHVKKGLWLLGLMNLLTLLGFTWGIFWGGLLLVSLLPVHAILIYTAKSFYRYRWSVGDFLLAQAVYPFYVGILGFLALFRPRFTWKGRRYVLLHHE
ncbi:MAG: glycosyltransferase [Bacteroidia bacterium]